MEKWSAVVPHMTFLLSILHTCMYIEYNNRISRTFKLLYMYTQAHNAFQEEEEDDEDIFAEDRSRVQACPLSPLTPLSPKSPGHSPWQQKGNTPHYISYYVTVDTLVCFEQCLHVIFVQIQWFHCYYMFIHMYVLCSNRFTNNELHCTWKWTYKFYIWFWRFISDMTILHVHVVSQWIFLKAL